MELFLVHRTYNGEPVGIWDSAGRNVYRNPSFEASGKSMIDTKGESLPWEDFVDKVERYTNYRDWWEGVRSNRTMLAVLDDFRRDYTTEEMGR